MQGNVQPKLFLDDRYQHVDADGDPDLRPHSILGSAVEAFDAQVLLDPLEEQFHLPSTSVQGMVSAGNANWLVRNTRFLPVSGSR